MARVLKEMEHQLDEKFLRGEIRDLAVKRFGHVGEAIIESLTRSIRSGKVWDQVAATEDPALQLRTALSDLFPQRRKLLTVVGRTFPDRDPSEVLESWANTVSKLN